MCRPLVVAVIPTRYCFANAETCRHFEKKEGKRGSTVREKNNTDPLILGPGEDGIRRPRTRSFNNSATASTTPP